MEVPQKLKVELPYDPAIPLLGIYPDKTLIWKDTYTPKFIVKPVTIAKTREQPVSINRWMSKEDAIQWNSSHKKNE